MNQSALRKTVLSALMLAAILWMNACACKPTSGNLHGFQWRLQARAAVGGESHPHHDERPHGLHLQSGGESNSRPSARRKPLLSRSKMTGRLCRRPRPGLDR